MMTEKGTVKSGAGTLKKKLLTYSAAAGAALTVAAPAHAAIQYSGLKNIPVNGTHPIQFIDLNGDGIDDFVFSRFDIGYTPYFAYQGVLMGGYQSGNSVLGATNWWFEPYRLGMGQMISLGAQGSWYSYGILNGRTQSYYSYVSYSYTNGNFIDQKGYIGVRFDISGSNHYGWIAYEGSGYTGGKITGWAYEDVADTAIAAGDTGGAPIPTLNQWGIIFFMGLILIEGTRRIKGRRETE